MPLGRLNAYGTTSGHNSGSEGRHQVHLVGCTTPSRAHTMVTSKVPFNRWTAREKSSWPLQVFQRYNKELAGLYYANIAGSRYTYSALKAAGAKWEDSVISHFKFDEEGHAKLFASLKSWSASYNDFQNWTNLNSLIAMSSNLETYVASVIALAIESDPGVLIGATRTVDGIKRLKQGNAVLDVEPQITACVKGDWNARAASYKRIFGMLPQGLERKLDRLNEVRLLRNKVGHAFGRDIEEARRHGVKNVLPMERLSDERTLAFQKLIFGVAKSVDRHLLVAHVGEYQALRYYHEIYPGLDLSAHPSIRAQVLKKKLGGVKQSSTGKVLCRQLVAYYESL